MIPFEEKHKNNKQTKKAKPNIKNFNELTRNTNIVKKKREKENEV